MQYWFNHHNLFSDNGASKTLFLTNPATRKNYLKDVLTTICWMIWSLEIILEKGELSSFRKPSAWWERTQRPLLTKVIFIKLEKLEIANFANFVSHPLGGNVLKDLFWQNCRVFKVLKFEKLEKTNFARFVSCPLGEKVLRIVLTKVWTFKSLDALEAPKSKKGKLCSFYSPPLGKKILKELFWQKSGLLKALKLE